MIWVEKGQIVSMHSELIEIFGGIDGVRDERFLDSALEAPFLTFNERAVSFDY
ncbi:MAG: cell filamentation protein Fic [Clostridia bacterium]|nr:cell filamentation protein Fic [Clostridia bacterium]